MYNTLKGDREPMPEWLAEYKIGDSIDLHKILSYRVLFYPGAGYDGQPLEAFNLNHTLHTYLYVDYWMCLGDAIKIYKEDSVLGYQPYDIVTLPISDLMPIYIKADMCIDHHWNKEYPDKFCTVCIYQRKKGFDDTHGAERFALIYTNEDGFRVFNITFHPQNKLPAPYVIVLQDYGLGGTYDRWSRGGLLERIANKYNIYPKYYIVGSLSGTMPWNMSVSCNDMPMRGEVDGRSRYLYKHSSGIYSQLEDIMLPVIENPLANAKETIKKLLPFVKGFILLRKSTYTYIGKTFTLAFIKQDDVNYDKIIDAVDLTQQVFLENWIIAPSSDLKFNFVLIFNDYTNSIALTIQIHQKTF